MGAKEKKKEKKPKLKLKLQAALSELSLCGHSRPMISATDWSPPVNPNTCTTLQMAVAAIYVCCLRRAGVHPSACIIQTETALDAAKKNKKCSRLSFKKAEKHENALKTRGGACDCRVFTHHTSGPWFARG